MATFPKFIPARAKGQRRNKHVQLNYDNVLIVGTFNGVWGYGTKAPGDLLLAEVDGMIYPCYRRSIPPGVTATAICQDTTHKAVKGKLEDVVYNGAEFELIEGSWAKAIADRAAI
jgi:hypothetical protein